jgi:hypothetical protein
VAEAGRAAFQRWTFSPEVAAVLRVSKTEAGRGFDSGRSVKACFRRPKASTETERFRPIGQSTILSAAANARYKGVSERSENLLVGQLLVRRDDILH